MHPSVKPPLTARTRKFLDLMKRADALRHDLHVFAGHPGSKRAVAEVMNEPHDQQAAFMEEIFEGMTAVVFVLRQFRLAVECDCSLPEEVDATRCRADD